MPDYDRGDTARLELLVKNAAGALVTPATLTLTVRTPAGVDTLTTSPAGPIVEDTVGVYHADIPLLESGTYGYQWETTAPAEVQGGILTVYPAPLDTGRRAVGDFTPSTSDVAALMFSRVTGEFAGVTEDFTTTTRPTALQATGMIALAVGHVSPLVGFNLDPQFHNAARFLCTLYTALLLEPGYWMEQQRPDKSAWEQWKLLYDDGLKSLLVAIAEVGAGGEAGPEDGGVAQLPRWYFPPAPCRREGIDY